MTDVSESATAILIAELKAAGLAPARIIELVGLALAERASTNIEIRLYGSPEWGVYELTGDTNFKLGQNGVRTRYVKDEMTLQEAVALSEQYARDGLANRFFVLFSDDLYE